MLYSKLDTYVAFFMQNFNIMSEAPYSVQLLPHFIDFASVTDISLIQLNCGMRDC